MTDTTISIWGSPDLLKTTKARMEAEFGNAAKAEIQTMVYRVAGQNEDRRVGFTPVNPETYSGTGKLTPMLSVTLSRGVADMDERLQSVAEALALEGVALDMSLSKRSLSAKPAEPTQGIMPAPIAAVA